MPTRLPAVLLLALAAPASACTSFATVRSAEVVPGPALTVQGSITSPVGDDVGWFYSFSCASGCDHQVASFDAALSYGWGNADDPYTLGVGMNGLIFPYVEGYMQLNKDPARDYGIGLRFGLPIIGWGNHQLYGRYDVPLSNGSRVLLNPGFFFHFGNSPNGANSGHFVALVQGVGLEHRGAHMTLVPAVTLVAGRGARDIDNEGGPFTTVFGAASVSVTFHRRRPAPASP